MENYIPCDEMFEGIKQIGAIGITGAKGIIRTEENALPEKLINGADTFEKLYAAIESIGPVKGGWYGRVTPEGIKNLIEDYRENGLSHVLDRIPPTHGIRDKVAELAEKEEREKRLPSDGVAAAKTFDELYAAIKKMGSVKGTCLLWKPEKLISRIEDFRADFREATLRGASDDELMLIAAEANITHSRGICDKAYELVKAEVSRAPES